MNSLVTMTLLNFHIVSGITKAVPWTKLIYTSPVSFRSSINSHIVKNGSLRERERGEREGGEGERVIPPPVTFRSSKISHTLKNGSKWAHSGHTTSPCGTPHLWSTIESYQGSLTCFWVGAKMALWYTKCMLCYPGCWVGDRCQPG